MGILFPKKIPEPVAIEPQVVEQVVDNSAVEVEAIEQKVSELTAEEQLLLNQLDTIRKNKKQLEQERLNKLPIVITVNGFANGYLQLSFSNSSIYPILGKYTDRVPYDGINYLKLENWSPFIVDVKASMNGRKIEFIDEKKLLEAIEQPKWTIARAQRYFTVKPNEITNYPPRADVQMHDIPGCNWDVTRKCYNVPFSEAWRLFEKFSSHTSVLYLDNVKEEIVAAIEKRLKLQKLQTATDSDWTVEFADPKFKLEPLQRVAGEFADTVDGKVLIAYPMGKGKTAISVGVLHKRNSERNLVICPASLKANWRRHIFNLTGEKPLELVGAMPSAFDMRDLLIRKPKWVVINYDILRRKSENVINSTTSHDGKHTLETTQDRYFWVELLQSWNPTGIIVDESHYTKNPSAHQSKAVRMLNADYKMALSGTPILNRPGELWATLNWLYPDTFPAYETFLNQYTYNGKEAKNVDQLRSLLSTMMVRRKAEDFGNYHDVRRITEYHDLSETAKVRYTKILAGVYEQIAAYDSQNRGGNEVPVTNILVEIMRLKQCCAEDKVEHTVELAVDAAENTEDYKNNKVLIFSQYKGTAYAIYQRLQDQGALCFVSRGDGDFITADNSARDDMVRRFQTDPDIKFLIVTEKTAKEGHDITKASTVIFNDLFWTPAAHQQGEARAFNRMIDPHGGNAYYVACEDTIEDWVIELQGIKDNTFQQIIEGASGGQSVEMEIVNRLRAMKWKK